jgi:cytoskeletal protein CcmA (bactofilin family)
MFSKSGSNTNPQPSPQPQSAPTPQPAAPQQASPATAHEAPRPAPRAQQKGVSTIGADMVLEGNISGGGEIQIDGVIKGDVRIEHVTVGDGGQVEGGIYAEAVEVRGRVSGSITAKQVRLYGACHVDGDITHEQLAMETGAFFQGRSLRLQRPAPAAVAPKPVEPAAAPPREALNAKNAPAAQA